MRRPPAHRGRRTLRRRGTHLSGVILAALCILALPEPITAQSAGDPGEAKPPPLRLPRLSGPIDFDGRVDEAAWAAVEPLPATMHVPTFGAAPSERTEFRVAYDDRYLYFSCRAWDSDPEGIRATSLQRDASGWANDWCAINLDTFDDRETELVFGTTPAGLRTDLAAPNDATGSLNFDWNTFWDAAVHRDPNGWSAEIRIPFASLRFQPNGAGQVVMGLGAWRLISRRNEIISFPPISPRWGTYSFLKASQLREVIFESVEPVRPVYVTPYALGGLGRSQTLNEAETAYERSDERVHDLGLDVKLGLASNLTLDLTFNTDFAQVEADDEQVNLTRFSLFFPEKRLFFQERGAIFEYSLGGDERLFHSRRIGLVGGEQVPLYAGARIVGRVGEWDVGFLDMQSGEGPDTAGENLGVLRVRRRVLNENSYVGGIVTSRVAGGGRYNTVYGLDALLRVTGQDFLTVNWAESFDAAGVDSGGSAGTDVGPVDRSVERILWERRGQDGLTYQFQVERSGRSFDPGLGYLRRRDFSAYSTQAGYGWRPGEASSLLRHTVTVPVQAYTRNRDGSLETLEITPQWEIELKSGRLFTPSLTWTYEDLEEGFDVGDAGVPPGQYRFATVRLEHADPGSHLFGVNEWVEAGSYYDGRRVSFSLSPHWRVSRHLDLRGTYRMDDIRFGSRDQAFRAHIAQVRAQVMADTRLSAAALVQYNSDADVFSTNIRFRFNPSEGHDLYVVWNQGINTDRFAYDPVRPATDRSTLLLKYSRTLTLEF